MPLHVARWWARLAGATDTLVLPFDHRYNGDNWDNRMKLSRVGGKASWEVFVDFTHPLDPGDPTYPHFAQLEDTGDFATLTFNNIYSERAGIQYGFPGSEGPIPTAPGKRDVRITLLNNARQPILSQSGSYFIDPG